MARAHAAESYMQNSGQGSGPESLQDGMREVLMRIPTDEARFKFLLDRSQEEMVGGDFEGILTPYHAKMVLYYLLDLKAKESNLPDLKRKSILNSTAANLRLKMENGKGSGWNNVVPHNGYVLGASGDMVNQLAHKQGMGKFGNGIDCTAAVQETLNVNLERSGFRGD